MVAGVAVSVTVWLVAFSGLWTRFFGEGVVNNALVGKTEDEVRKKYGEPNWEKQGYEPLGLQPSGPNSDERLKTLIFEPRGLFHLEGGTYWVWFYQQDGVWVCWMSCWYADSVRF